MDTTKICNALGSEIRYQIVKSLAGQVLTTCCDRIGPDEHGFCVDDIVMATGLAQSTVSQHLQVLVDSGVLSKEKRGKWTCFFLDLGLVDAFLQRLGADLAASRRPEPVPEASSQVSRSKAVSIVDFDIETD